MHFQGPAGYRLIPQPHPRTHSAPLTASQPLFGGQVPGSETSSDRLGKLGKFLAWAAVLGGAGIAAPATVRAQAVAEQTQTSTTQVYTDRDQAGNPIKVVSSAKDLAHINQESLKLSHQDIVDLYDNPLLSAECKKGLNILLSEFRKSGVGEMNIFVINDTDQEQMTTINGELYEQVKLGDIYKKNGVSILVNATTVREKNPKRGKINIQVGRGLNHIIFGPKATELVRENAIPHIMEGNPDLAMESLVKAIIQKLNENVKPSDPLAGTPAGQAPVTPTGQPSIPPSIPTNISKEDAQDYTQALVLLGLILAGAVTIGTGGYFAVTGINSYLAKKKKFEEDSAVIRAGFEAFGATPRLSAKSLYSPATVMGLLSGTAQQPGAASKIITALQVVDANMKPEDKPNTLPFYRDNGLSNPEPEVRIHAINHLMKNNPKRDDLFTPLMTQMLIETDDSVIKAMNKPLTDLAVATDVESTEDPPKPGPFRQNLQSKNAQAREISISVMKKFANARTAGYFFDHLKAETAPNNIELLQVYLTKLATSENRDLFLTHLATDAKAANYEALKKAAVQGLGHIKNKADFQALFENFLKDESPLLAQSYEEALQNTASQANVGQLNTALTQDAIRVQNMALKLLGELKSSDSVEAVFGYFNKNVTAANAKQAEKALNVLKKSVAKENRTFLVDQLPSKKQDKAGNPQVTQAALELSEKFLSADDVTRLFDALNAEKTEGLQQQLSGLIQKNVNASNHQILVETLNNGSVEPARLIAAKSLEGIAKPADVPAIFTALASESGTQLTELIQTLGHLAYQTADATNHDAVMEKLEQSTDKRAIRWGASVALTKLAVPSDLPKLFTVVAEEKDQTGENLTTAIGNAVKSGKVDDACHTLLMDKLKDAKPLVRLAAAKGLHSQALPTDIPALFDAFQSEKTGDVDTKLAQVIAKKSDATNHDFLVDKLTAPLAKVRTAAANGLMKCVQPTDAATLIQDLEKETDTGVQNALKPLVQKTMVASNKSLILTKLESSSLIVRQLALEALETLGNAADLPTFFTALEKEADATQSNGLTQLIANKTDATNHDFLVGKLTASLPKIRLATANGLSKCVKPTDVEKLIQSLETESDSGVQNALKPLVQKTMVASNKSLILKKLQSSSLLVRQLMLAALENLAVASDVPTLFNALSHEITLKEGDAAQADGIIRLIAQKADASNHDALMDKLIVKTPLIRKAAATALAKLVKATDAQALIQALETEDQPAVQTLLKPLVSQTLVAQNKGLIFNKISSPSLAVRQVLVTAVQKMAETSDLPILLEAWGRESDSGVKQSLLTVVRNEAKSSAAIPFLGLAVNSAKQVEARTQAVDLLIGHGTSALETLFDSLGKTDYNTPQGLVTKMKEAILTAGRDASNLKTLVKHAKTQNENVRQVAAQAVSNIVNGWQSASYDDKNTLATLEDLSNEANSIIATAAGAVYNAILERKIDEIKAIARKDSNIHQESAFRTLHQLAQNAPESKIKTAAKAAHADLTQKLEAWEEAEAERQRIEAENARIAAALAVQREREAAEQREREDAERKEREEAAAAQSTTTYTYEAPSPPSDNGNNGGSGDTDFSGGEA